MRVEVGLVGCAAGKLAHAAPARELYVSPLFRKSVAYVEQVCQRWFILSAKHGLVRPDQVLRPYNERLTPATKKRWEERVLKQLREELGELSSDFPRYDYPELIVLAGEQYRGWLPRGQWPYQIPMEGLGIGEQLAWLTNELRAA